MPHENPGNQRKRYTVKLPRALRTKLIKAASIADTRMRYGRQDENAMKLEQLISDIYDDLCEEGLLP